MQWKLLGITNVDFDSKVNYRSYILHSSNTGEKMGIQQSSTKIF